MIIKKGTYNTIHIEVTFNEDTYAFKELNGRYYFLGEHNNDHIVVRNDMMEDFSVGYDTVALGDIGANATVPMIAKPLMGTEENPKNKKKNNNQEPKTSVEEVPVIKREPIL